MAELLRQKPLSIGEPQTEGCGYNGSLGGQTDCLPILVAMSVLGARSSSRLTIYRAQEPQARLGGSAPRSSRVRATGLEAVNFDVPRFR
jgi:hypothetical protein